MATKRIQKNRKNSSGGFDVIHYETEAAVTYMEDGRTVEEAVGALEDGIPDGSAYIKKAGDTMTGPLKLAGDPTDDLHAATKQYVDDVAGQAQVGAKGDPGDPGPKGDDGEDGGYYSPAVDDAGTLSWTPSKAGMPAIASTNIKGPKGDTGPAGADGADGLTPQKGVDYWTAEDKAEILEELGGAGTPNDVSDLDALLDAINGKKVWVPGLPPVTEADDGKVLGVKDGIWSAVLNGTSSVEGLELWNDITLEEDTNTIFLDKKDNGQPFKIQELFIGIFGTLSGDGGIAVSYNKGNFYQLWKNYKRPVDGDGTPSFSLFWLYSRRLSQNVYLSLMPEELLNQNAKYENDTEFASQGLSGSNKGVTSDIAFYTGTELAATDITIKITSAAVNFLSGSRILIYGRDIDA